MDNPGPAYKLGSAGSEQVIDWYAIAKHVTPCPRCGQFLTSLWLCPECGVRFELQEMSTSTSDQADLCN
jgi:hypothetical protein